MTTGHDAAPDQGEGEGEGEDQRMPRRPPEPPAGLSRRSVLLGAVGVGGAALGVGGVKLREQITAASSPPPPVPATEDLTTDHGLLKRILLIYREASRRLVTGDVLDPILLYRSAQIVHNYIEGFHEGIEDAYIFPALVRAGKLTDTVRTLLVQHDRGRHLTVAIIGASTPMGMGPNAFGDPAGRAGLVASLDAFVAMCEPHEAREDTVVFPTFREITPTADFTRLSARIVEVQHDQLGDDRFAQMLGQVADVENRLGIGDLNRFTPASNP